MAATAHDAVAEIPTHKHHLAPAAALSDATLAGQPLDWYLRKLEAHRARYTGLGKAEWWWLFEDTLADVAAALSTHHMVWLDGFLLDAQARDLRGDVVRVRVPSPSFLVFLCMFSNDCFVSSLCSSWCFVHCRSAMLG